MPFPDLHAALLLMMGKEPSAEIVQRVFQAGNGANEEAVSSALMDRHERGYRVGTLDGPRSWRWFVMIVQNHFCGGHRKVWFEDFWTVYWRKVNKPRAEDTFLRIVTTEGIFRQMMDSIEAQTPEMNSRKGCFIPHPATWLAKNVGKARSALNLPIAEKP